MDPKSTASLDPKLQEAYDRVMGIALDPTAAPSQSAPAPTQPAQPSTLPGQAINPQPAGDLATPPMPSPMPGDTSLPSASPSPLPESPVAPASPTAPDLSTTTPTPPTEETVQVAAAPTVSMESTVATGKPHAFVAKSGGKKISPVIWILGGVVFLVIYTIICFKIFNVPIPFIGQ